MNEMFILFAIVSVAISVVVVVLVERRRVLPPNAEAVINDVMSRELPELLPGRIGYADSDGVRIWYEIQEPAATSQGTVLLIPGLAGDALFWPREFVERLLDAGYAVIRFDLRGTGMSDWIPEWKRRSAYSTRTMAHDVVAILDASGISRVHAVGVSLGGIIAQHLAINHGDRLCSVTTIMAPIVVEDPSLPQVAMGYLLRSMFIGGLPILRYQIAGGEKNLIRVRLAKLLQFGEAGTFNSTSVAQTVLYDLRRRRGLNMKAIWQHFVAVARGPYTYAELESACTPTLVIHGTDDKFVPLAHGRRLAEALPVAKGVWVEGAGHVFPFGYMKTATQAILGHIAANAC